MEKLAIPFLMNNFRKKEEALEFLKEAGADTAIIAVDIVSVNPQKYRANFDEAEEWSIYFKSYGFETGIWLWTLWRTDLTEREDEDYLIIGPNGEKSMKSTSLNSAVKRVSGAACPSSEKFLKDMYECVQYAAGLKTDFLLFDDDLRYANHIPTRLGCFCDTHMKLVNEALGTNYTREELFKEIYAPKPNKARSTWLKMLGESIENLAKTMREAADSVNPEMRIGICSVMSLWDFDGIDSIKVARILAGNTKPLLRLTGAPYWAVWPGWGFRLHHTFECERMERAWVNECGDGLETYTENDGYPRPRHQVSASFIEAHDTVMRAAGVATGSMKYIMDYTSKPFYENGYLERHKRNQLLYKDIDRFFADKVSVGVKVYEFMKRFENADLTGIKNPEKYVEDMFFFKTARMLADNSIPTTYDENTGVGIAFGENARYLPDSAFENGLIIDIRAAKILTEKGVDVGLRRVGDSVTKDLLYFPKYDDMVKGNYTDMATFEIEIDDSAEAIIYSVDGEKNYIDAYHYENALGQKFLVYSFDIALTDENRYRNYLTQLQLFDSIEWLSGKKNVVKCIGNPDLYVLAKQKGNETAIGLWNLFTDEIITPTIELDREYTEAEFVNCTGELKGDKVVLSTIHPYGMAFINLK